MLDPAMAFDLAGMLAMLGWLGLLISLFLAAARPVVWPIAQLAIPALLAIAYVLLIARGMGAEGGGFGSIEQVRALFADDSALAAGWLHYLAFDLFVGAWIVRDGIGREIHPLLILPCLPLTFLFGPAGLLLYLLVRLAVRPRTDKETAR
ncbi:abscisic acid-deficient protein Aba4 family protein [Sphingosinicella sp. CPCC 101087]|uniref:abscisic acid-deficient protein Aba4 family protein n=1 Tax=Sphingosinicella sp. CPCC 101087 TaxID=2497754 RepID=UPI00101C7D23|nr:abscisic acid-deficient protein Aba4 family protein [Sphingosinicella sp. CPCC 101087]